MGTNSVLDMSLPEVHALIKSLNAGGTDTYDLGFLGKNSRLIKKVLHVIRNYSIFNENGRYILQRDLEFMERDNATQNLCELLSFSDTHRISNIREKFEEIFGDKVNVSDESNRYILENRFDALKKSIESDNRISNLLKGPWYPIFLPSRNVFGKTKVKEYSDTSNNIGDTLMSLLSESFIPPLQNNIETFGWSSNNDGCHIGSPQYCRFLKKEILNSRDPKLAIYFPTAFYEYSLKDPLYAQQLFPNNMFLSGPIETSIALSLYPEELLRNDEFRKISLIFPFIWMSIGLTHGFGTCFFQEKYNRLVFGHLSPNHPKREDARYSNSTVGITIVEK